MNKFLERIKLIDYLTVTLQISRTEFVKRLLTITDNKYAGLFDISTSVGNEYKGQVDIDGFKLRRRRRFGNAYTHLATANGQFSDNNGHLIVMVKIDGYRNDFQVFYACLIIFYSFAIDGMIHANNDISIFLLLIFLVYGTAMFLGPYFMMKKGVQQLKYELERKFIHFAQS